ncbi:hypothetical protein ACN20G_29940 (plasmid) [Streptomyces sp. BI20]|uniref:hypothetical protein n=1 Tax=Streptomyces sp. BI20 TaxID=3403460 RepID=UPI003C7514C1
MDTARQALLVELTDQVSSHYAALVGRSSLLSHNARLHSKGTTQKIALARAAGIAESASLIASLLLDISEGEAMKRVRSDLKLFDAAREEDGAFYGE